MNRYCSILILSLILSFLLIGCSQDSIHGTPPPLHKVKWGMNEAEAKSALGLSDNDVKKTASGFIIKGEIYSKSAELTLIFTEQYHTLVEINVKIKPEDVEYVEKAITKERGTGEYSYNDKTEPTLVGWDDELLEKDKESLSTVKDLYNKSGIKTSDDSLDNGVSIGSRPLTRWEMILDKDNPLYGTVRFMGQIAAMLNDPEKYNTK